MTEPRDTKVLAGMIEMHEHALAELNGEFKRARERDWGLVPGLTILLHNGARYEYRKLGAYPSDTDSKPWVSAAKIRKDGQPALTTKSIFDEWEIAE